MLEFINMERIDYLVIGHITCDLTPAGPLVGGTVSFSGRTAQILGGRTAVVTSATADYHYHDALPGIDVVCIPALETTTFENIYTPQGRQQILHAIAAPLTTADIPTAWQRAQIVHLGPLANEVEPEMIHLFSNSLIGLTPQGWHRRWDENGRVHNRAWEKAAQILPLVTAVILSEEDLLDEAMLERYRRWSRLLVLTQGKAGCTIFGEGEAYQIPAPCVTEVESTGAGDIFAAAFLMRLCQTDGNPWEAARFANEIAAQSVTQTGLDAKMEQIRNYQAKNVIRDT